MADDDNKIIVPIDADTSEFDAKVDASFEKAGQGNKSAGDERGSKAPPNLEAAALGESNEDIGKSAEAVRLFREALHVLHPAIEDAGGSLGVMTGLLRASTGGIVALAAAIGGLLVTS